MSIDIKHRLTFNRDSPEEKLLYTAFFKMHPSQRVIINEKYGEEDFLQDVRLALFKELGAKPDLLEQYKLSSIIFKTMTWHYSSLFSNSQTVSVPKKGKRKGTLDYNTGSVERSQGFLFYTGTLVSNDGESLSTELTDALNGTYDYDYTKDLKNNEIIGAIHKIFSLERYKHLIGIVLYGQTINSVAEVQGTLRQVVAKQLKKAKKELLDYLEVLGYNIDNDLKVSV